MDKNGTELFYKNLKTFDSESDIFNEEHYCELPEDWSVIITDIENSTDAIEKGLYKIVNTIAVASIIAVKNQTENIEIPYIFGGDGAYIFIPSAIKERSIKALKNTKNMAHSEFKLNLRVHSIEYSEIKKIGGSIFISKRKLSSSASIAMAKGSGLTILEKIAKNLPRDEVQGDSSYSGDVHRNFSCKFAPIPSRNGEILTLIIENCEEKNSLYKDLISFLKSNSTPIDLEYSYDTVQYSSKSTFNETKLFHSGITKYFHFIFKDLLFRSYAFIMKFQKKPFLKLQSLTLNTDQIKFDNFLRMILDVNQDQKVKILSYLNKLSYAEQIIFGYHISDSALLTCYVASPTEDHFHFIDGNHGGYVMASKHFKKMKQKLSHQSKSA